MALIVDSDGENRVALGRLVKMAGYEPSLAADGRQAVKMFAHEVYELAVINATLTDMSAVDVARRLRRRMEAENFGPTARIVCIVGSQKECSAYPDHLIDAFLVAPITAKGFQAAIGARSLRAGARTAAGSPRFSSVVVDR